MIITTKPVHTPVYCVLEGWVPGLVRWLGFGVVNDVAYAVAYLESSEVAGFSVPDTKN